MVRGLRRAGRREALGFLQIGYHSGHKWLSSVHDLPRGGEGREGREGEGREEGRKGRREGNMYITLQKQFISWRGVRKLSLTEFVKTELLYGG